MAGKGFSIARLTIGLMTSWTFDTYGLRERNRIIFMNVVSYTGVLFMALYSFTAFQSHNVPLGLSTLIASLCVLLILGGMWIFRLFSLAGWLITLAMAGLFGYLAWSGGENGSGILWIQAFPFVAMFLINVTWGSVLSLAFMAFIAITLFAPGMNNSHFTAAYSMRVLGVYGYVWLFGLVYGILRGRTEQTLVNTNDQLSQTTSELSFEKKQTDGILKNVKEGIFLLDKKLTIGLAHSSHMAEIFEKPDLAGSNLLDVLRPVLGERDHQAAADWLPMLFANSVNPTLLAEINPLGEVRAEFFDGQGLAREKYLRFNFTRIQLESEDTTMLGVVRDVTEEVLLQRKIELDARRHQQAMEKLFQVIHVDPAMMAEFILDTEAELDSVNSLLRDQDVSPKEIMPHMFQSVHGIKGNALLLGLNELARRVHEVEEQVKPFLEVDCTWKELLGLTVSLGMIQQELEEIRGLIDKIISFQTSSTEHGLSERGLLERTLSRMLETEASRQGKNVKLVFDGFDSHQIPDSSRKLVKDVLVQLMRNALVHGIETPQERQRLGKDAQACLTLSMSRDAESIQIALRDDGRGLDLEAIRDKAGSILKMPEAEIAALKPTELAQLIFRTGFSTSAQADLGSGRGVGMALVKTRVEAIGGRVGLKSRAGQLCEVTFRIPLTIPAYVP